MTAELRMLAAGDKIPGGEPEFLEGHRLLSQVRSVRGQDDVDDRLNVAEPRPRVDAQNGLAAGDDRPREVALDLHATASQ